MPVTALGIPRTEVLKLAIRGAYVPSLTAIGAIADESGDPDTSTTLTFQIFLDQKVKHNVSVDYATQDGTAKAGVNYTHTSGTVTFAPREQVKTVDVDILDDGEGGSTYFKLVLSNPKGAGLRANHPGTGRILDTLQLFRTWDASAREGNTTISFVVEFNHREPGDTADYTVDYRTEDITATAGADYVSTSGTLTFTPADGDLVVPVTIKDDDIRDNGETFRLVLSNPSSGVTLHRTAATAIGTILNHDSEGLTATFPASAYASKSHKGPTDRPQVVVAFNSSVASISTTTPSVVVNGASITSVQAHTEDGLQNAQIFFLEPDGNDDITFTLVANVACASGGICSGTGTPITQVPSAHTIPAKQTAMASQLSVADAAASEEDDSTIDFVVTLSPASEESVTVDYATANGSASTGDDYTAASGSLTFNAGETSKTIQVSIIDDTVVDDNETLTVTLSNASGAEISDGQATGAITDGDTESVPLTAAFQDLPDSHDGSTAFTFRVLFSEDVGISYVNMRDDAFSLSEGDVTGARRVDGRSDLWEITVEPDGNSGVGITLPANRSCSTAGAICTKEDSPRQLTNSPSAMVTGPADDSSSDTPSTPATSQLSVADATAIRRTTPPSTSCSHPHRPVKTSPSTMPPNGRPARAGQRHQRVNNPRRRGDRRTMTVAIIDADRGGDDADSTSATLVDAEISDGEAPAPSRTVKVPLTASQQRCRQRRAHRVRLSPPVSENWQGQTGQPRPSPTDSGPITRRNRRSPRHTRPAITVDPATGHHQRVRRPHAPPTERSHSDGRKLSHSGR